MILPNNIQPLDLIKEKKSHSNNRPEFSLALHLFKLNAVLTHFNSQGGDSIIYNGKCAPDLILPSHKKQGEKFQRNLIVG